MPDFSYLASLARISEAMSGRYVVRSAMTPFLWSCVFSPFCFVAAYFLRENAFLSTAIGLAGCLPIAVASIVGVIFVFRDPDRLHSEEYRLKRYALEITDTKGGKLSLESVQLADIANPYPEQQAIETKAMGQEANGG